MWDNLRLIIPLIRKYSSKGHSSFLDYHMKLLHCHVDVTAIAIGADLRPCQTSMTKCFAKRIHHYDKMFCKKKRS